MRYPNGYIGWIDLMTGDTGTACQFYEALFGWSKRDVRVPEGDTHTHFYRDDALVAGMSHHMPGAPAMAAWTTYVIVDDLDASCDAVSAAGGIVTRSAWTHLDAGRMAIVEDPTGTVFGLLEPAQMQGAELFNAPGAMTWNELQTRDLDAARPFYEKVFGWRWRVDQQGYWIAELPTKPGDDKTIAGAMTMPAGVPAGAPNSWLVYFAVEDCDKTVAVAEQLGAEIFLATVDVPPGRIAGITDPTGGMFLILQSD